MNTVTTALARVFEGIAYGARAVSRSAYRISEELDNGSPEAQFWVAYAMGYLAVVVMLRGPHR